MKTKTLLLDVDGVLSNFIDAACKLCGHDPREVETRWTPGDYNFHELLGLTRNDFYGNIAKAGAHFWEWLEPLPHAQRLVDECCALAPTFFCTTPTRDAGSLPGKRAWLEKMYGRIRANNAVFTEHKHLLARRGTLLVDDRDDNVDAFKKAGGTAILFPAISNRRHGERHRAFDLVLKEIKEWAQD